MPKPDGRPTADEHEQRARARVEVVIPDDALTTYEAAVIGSLRSITDALLAILEDQRARR